MGSMLTDLQQNWLVYIVVVAIAGLVGWITKVVAIEMMFKPIDFKGIRIGPIPIGWQGVIPRRAAHMTNVATTTIVEKLIKPSELWSRIDAARLTDAIRQPFVESIEPITRQAVADIRPGLWDEIPSIVKNQAIQRLQKDGPAVIERVIKDTQLHVDEVLDLRVLMTQSLVYDKTILQQVFRRTGRREWAFIRRFGGVAGLLIGVAQVALYSIVQLPVVNPIMGLLNGWVTDYFCIKGLLFNPKHPKKYLGIFTWQGLFLKYQSEVSDELAQLIEKEVLTPRAIIDTMVHGPFSDRFFLLIRQHVKIMMEEELGVAKPAALLAFGSSNYDKAQTVLSENLMDSLSDTLSHADEYIHETLSIGELLAEKLKEMPPEEFEQVLRPAFQQDEWILIGTGAVLGAVAGVLQDVVIELFAR
jgi:uncharacterized membrane protein YheB (UPF0754 family)